MPATITSENPMGLDGFDFLEFASPEPAKLIQQFTEMGFKAVAEHKSKKVTLYRQGDINFILNQEPNSFAATFAGIHGAGACAMGFRVADAQQAFDRAVELGATPVDVPQGEGELHLLAIEGIGDTLVYFIDKYETDNIFNHDFNFNGSESDVFGAGLLLIDHLTHNVRRGNMDTWAGFYEKLFNFKQIRFFNIQGKATGLISRAMGSPCGKIKIPLNEALDDQSQIEEFIRDYNGEGIQHIALNTGNIYDSVETLKDNDVDFLTVPDTYYEMLPDRKLPHNEDLDRMMKNRILIDGGEEQGGGILLQIFTQTMLGPAFFEIIQRKGNDGFGEGNFQALFVSIELDQIRRGVLQVPAE